MDEGRPGNAQPTPTHPRESPLVTLFHAPRGNQGSNFLHLVFGHALGGHCGSSDPDTRSNTRRLWVVGDRVLVEHDASSVAAFLRLGAGDSDALQIQQSQVGVRAARDRSHAFSGQRLCERLCVGNDLTGVLLVGGVAASFSATALAATACMSGPPCIMGNTALSIAAACSSLLRIIPPRGPRRTLCVVNVTTSAYGTGLGIAFRQPDR